MYDPNTQNRILSDITDLVASFTEAEYQDLPCYFPAILETRNGATRRITLDGDPLPTKKAAEKYAQIEINRRLSCGRE